MQQITLASFINAKKYTGDKHEIWQLICHHKSRPVSFDASFTVLPPLERGVSDGQRTLPFLKDILELAVKNSSAEYIIYSNADIGLMPQFYNAVADQIRLGHDALVINRRRIKSTLNSVNDLDRIYSEVGKDHIGYDMFVFRRDLFEKFILFDSCIGIPFVGNDLFYNLFCFAQKPALLTDQHLTFHIGLELVKEWGNKELKKQNYEAFHRTVKALQPKMDITKFPGAEMNFFRRQFKWLMNPTLIYPVMLTTDLKQLSRPRTKKVYDPNYKKQSYFEWLLKRINFD